MNAADVRLDIDNGSSMIEVGRLRLRLKVPMTVHEIYNRDKARLSVRYCKQRLARVARRAWRQSLQQGFGGEVPPIHGHW